MRGLGIWAVGGFAALAMTAGVMARDPVTTPSGGEDTSVAHWHRFYPLKCGLIRFAKASRLAHVASCDCVDISSARWQIPSSW